MTTIPSGKDPMLRELIASVQQLDAHVQDNALKVEELAQGEERLERARRRHGLWIILTVFGLVLDLALSGLFVRQHVQQNCINALLKNRQAIAQRNFTAEYDKVVGQVAGLTTIRGAGADRAKAFAGFDQFISASELYLKRISAIHEDQNKHPLTGC